MKKIILLVITSSIFYASTYAAALGVVPMSASEIDAISGHYSSIYGYVNVKPGQHGVLTDFNGKRIIGAKKSDGYYYSTFKLIGIIPISLRMSLSKVNGMHRVTLDSHAKKKVVGQQFKPTPISTEWRKRLGSYRAKAINGKSKIAKVALETQNGVVVIRFNNGKYAYPLVSQRSGKLVRPTIGRPRQRHMEVWPAGKTLAAIIGNIRLKLEKI